MDQPGLIGQRVDRYQIERLLGAGGFGSVYRARHVHTDATVALKLLKKSLGADHQMLERFLREARAAASVGSEHIVRVMDAGIAGDQQAFLALEYLDGLDLKELRPGPGSLALPAGGAAGVAGARSAFGGPRQGHRAPRHEAGERLRGAAARRAGHRE